MCSLTSSGQPCLPVDCLFLFRRHGIYRCCHNLMTLVIVSKRPRKRLRFIWLLQHLKLRNFILNKVAFQFTVVFLFILHFYFISAAFEVASKLFPLRRINSIRNPWPVKSFDEIFSAYKCVILSSSLRFKTFSYPEKLATWAVHWRQLKTKPHTCRNIIHFLSS